MFPASHAFPRKVVRGVKQVRVGGQAVVNMGRSGFGETHYLDDIHGDALYAMEHIEAELTVFNDTCRTCPALTDCPGILEVYATRHGLEEFAPLVGDGSSADLDALKR